MRNMEYNRFAAVAYARKWALSRNPAFYDFQNIGGDCTSFASQCLYAGASVMNYTPIMGWYYRSASDRTASWSGVEFFCNFIINNRSVGPYGHIAAAKEIQPGDFVQLGTESEKYYHTLVVTAVSPGILVSAHTFDALDRPLSSYNFFKTRFLRIDGVRTW